ncbi:hypothetical protein DFP73DRAFT_531691 [Morchella snyderi]|nr:hypothetical protein DFP73DRAFT_531691 [Morchella snyderi]
MQAYLVTPNNRVGGGVTAPTSTPKIQTATSVPRLSRQIPPTPTPIRVPSQAQGSRVQWASQMKLVLVEEQAEEEEEEEEEDYPSSQAQEELLGENAEEVADDTEDLAEKKYRVRAPEDLSETAIRAALDKSLYIGKKTKRLYDSSRFDKEFVDDGEFWNTLISISRLYFCRYLQIHDEEVVGIVSQASGGKPLNPNLRGYRDAYQWILVDGCLVGLEGKNLCDAYGSHYTFDNFYMLMGTTRAVVNWNMNLDQPRAKGLYKTLFTFSLVYPHLSRQDPLMYNRTTCMDKVRLIGIRSEYKDLGVDIVILLPPKPPSKVCYRKQKNKDLLNNDEIFMPFSDDEDDNGAPAAIPDGENIFDSIFSGIMFLGSPASGLPPPNCGKNRSITLYWVFGISAITVLSSFAITRPFVFNSSKLHTSVRQQ